MGTRFGSCVGQNEKKSDTNFDGGQGKGRDDTV